MNQVKEKPPVINCHTHIFTGDHVPPYLAKTFIPCPLYYILKVSTLVGIFRYWFYGPFTWQFRPWYKHLQKINYKIKMFVKRNQLLSLVGFIVGLWLTIQVFFILFDWLSGLSSPTSSIKDTIESIRKWLAGFHLIYIPSSLFAKLGIILLLFLFFKPGRNLILMILKKLWSFLKVFPGPKTKELANRYLNIGRYAFYHDQSEIFERLSRQYPSDTGFVVLPMDMAFMEAGKLKDKYSYGFQMADLAIIKANPIYTDKFFPFVFAEPRRIIEEGIKQFDYTIKDGKVILEDCFIKSYIIENKFNGFKIYPALGYYPFDEALLPLWKYAADENLPITTHCIRGTIYYRGLKKRTWDNHPVFEQSCGDDNYEPLMLNEIKNMDFINNFTHPLNYLCLLEEELLRKLVSNAKDDRIRELFGFNGLNKPMDHNLNKLKICFGHYGGDEEWTKFMESDRDNYSPQLIKNPTRGIEFLKNEDGIPKRGKIEQIWRSTDWYSIISSMMLQYPVYADISYILHNLEIQPLLNQTLKNPGLKEKVLYGTDFYVVRNHKTDKNMLAEMLDNLTEEEFDMITRENPRKFLSSKLHGDVKI